MFQLSLRACPASEPPLRGTCCALSDAARASGESEMSSDLGFTATVSAAEGRTQLVEVYAADDDDDDHPMGTFSFPNLTQQSQQQQAS